MARGALYIKCFHQFFDCLVFEFVSPICMKQADICKASFHSYICQIAYYNVSVSQPLELPVQDILRPGFVAAVFVWFELCGCVIGNQSFPLHDPPDPASGYLLPCLHQLLLYFACSVIVTACFKNFRDFRWKFGLIRLSLCLVIISASVYLQDAAHC